MFTSLPYPGPSLVIGYAPCEMHSIKGGMVNCQKEMKKAVECGYWKSAPGGANQENRFSPAAYTWEKTLRKYGLVR